MENLITQTSFWLALIISIGSLFFYIRLALLSRKHRKDSEDENYDFHLGLSLGNNQNKNQVFAYALVAAGTSLSTVFVFFLTASAFFGWLTFLSPIMFAIGNYVMFKVYSKAEKNEFFNEKSTTRSGLTGLIPYLGETITGSKKIGLFLVALSFINLLAVLVLELFIGADILSFLFSNTLKTQVSTPDNFSIIDFLIFSISVALLLSYVVIGGFRAVISSDFWQMKAMKTTIVIVFISSLLTLFIRNSGFDFSLISVKATGITLIGFVLNVILANIFAPMSQESSWQRFRAFKEQKKEEGFDINVSMKKSIANSLILWIGLILISFFLVVLSNGAPLANITDVLKAFQTIDNVWFPLLVFPLLTSACLFAMYSTADTCVSALIYLIDYFYSSKHPNKEKKNKLEAFHKVGMLFIFIVSILVYLFIHKFFNPTILQLVFSVFSNLVVIAPTILLSNFLKPSENKNVNQHRKVWVFISLILGSIAYWSSSIFSLVKGADYLWLSQFAILAGLIFALLPILPIVLSKNSKL
ncbi:MAG: hypothetical protein KDE33_01450 [Bacteroidetes bacterium]|nr:hypothetical protein [Bacteroidota bacterium]